MGLLSKCTLEASLSQPGKKYKPLLFNLALSIAGLLSKMSSRILLNRRFGPEMEIDVGNDVYSGGGYQF
ncbi:Uncharacterised protein [uncultured archaeon]|nr:Uncharacterised protein [uncultured archaeon]